MLTVSFRGFGFAVLAFAIVGFVASTGVDADVPKAEDVAECNTEAQDAIRPGSAARGNAVPNTSDHSRVAQARQNETSSENRLGHAVAGRAARRYGWRRCEGSGVSGGLSRLYATEGVLMSVVAFAGAGVAIAVQRKFFHAPLGRAHTHDGRG